MLMMTKFCPLIQYNCLNMDEGPISEVWMV